MVRIIDEILFSMKIGKNFLWGIAGVLALSSCQNASNEVLENIGTETEKWRITMSVSEIESRASVDENQVVSGGRLPVRWDKSDKIKMMIGTDVNHVSPCEFILQGESSINSAVFEYEGDKIDSYYYYGVYPSSLDFDKEGNVHLSVPVDGTIQQIDSDDSRHLGLYRSMYASPVEREESSSQLTGVVFKHLTGLIVFKLTNLTSKDVNVKTIQLSTSDGTPVFYSKALFNPVTEESATVTGIPVSSTTLSFAGNGYMIPSGKMYKAYLPVLPTDDFSHTPLIIRTTMEDGEEIETELPLVASTTLKKFSPGGYCIFNVKKTATGLTVGVETAGWENGTEIVIPVD